MAQKKKQVHRVNKTDWYHPGDLKGFLLMFLALIIVVLSTLAVKAIVKTQGDEAEVMDILLSEQVNSDTDGVCVAQRKGLELSGGDNSTCYSRAMILCDNGAKKSIGRQDCMTQDKWSVFADAFCGSIEVECK